MMAMARSAFIIRHGVPIVVAAILLASACGSGDGRDTHPPPNLRVTGVVPLSDVPPSAYDIICPDEPRGVIGPGLECIDDDEVPSLSHIHFRADTNGSWGWMDSEVEVLDRGLDVVWHTRGFTTEMGERRWIGRITLDDWVGCRKRLRGKVLRLRISAKASRLGATHRAVARVIYEGNCRRGGFRLLNGDPFDPTLVYHNDQGWSTAEGPPIPQT